MAKYHKSCTFSHLSIFLLIVFISASYFSISGCSNLFGQEQKKKAKDSFLDRLKKKDVPGQDIKDFPRYLNCRRVSYTIISGEGGKRSGVIVYQSDDSKEKVRNYFASEAPKKGWTIREVVDTAEGKIYQFTKDTRHISLSVAHRSKAKYTEITLIYREY